MKITQLSFLLFLSLLLSDCKKEESTPLELVGFKIKTITINQVPIMNFDNTCWDELDCDNVEGNPDIYFRMEQDGSGSLNGLDFFTSEVFDNYANEQELIITPPDRVFVTGFLYQFVIYDKDGVEFSNDDRLTSIPFLAVLSPQLDEPLPTTITGFNDGFMVELEYVYQ